MVGFRNKNNAYNSYKHIYIIGGVIMLGLLTTVLIIWTIFLVIFNITKCVLGAMIVSWLFLITMLILMYVAYKNFKEL